MVIYWDSFLVSLQDHIVLKEDETPKKPEGQQQKLSAVLEKTWSEEQFLMLLF